MLEEAMSAVSNAFVAQLNGRPATPEALAPIAFAGFAHFTAMQVRGRKIRGLDLHLERLRSASMTLFGRAMPDDEVRRCLQTALENGAADLSLTATMYQPQGEFALRDTVAPEVLVRTGPAYSGPEGSLSLATFEHERFFPSIKHVGETAKTYYLRQAGKQGFSDAVFIDRRGRISEGSIWNLAFWDGAAVIWPDAEMLTGVTMQIVRRQLERLGISQRVQEITLAELPKMTGAVVMNSWTPGVAVSRIGSVPLPRAPEFVSLLHRAYEAETPTYP
jgi:branched-subunit amino acid aminotransferase/4-amino-4-deoxychorismate lyase